VRSGVRWIDGRDLTAEDVAFTIGLYRIKALGSNLWDHVSDARAADSSNAIHMLAEIKPAQPAP
jgi:ABC-type transport system substrate-binding protein